MSVNENIIREPSDVPQDVPPKPAVAEEETHKQELLAKTKEIVDHRKMPAQHTTKSGAKAAGKPGGPFWKKQGHLVISVGLFSIIAFYVTFGLCRGILNPPPQAPRTISAESLLPPVVTYGGKEMPGKTFVKMEATRRDKDPELVGEISKIIDSGGMPADVFQDDVPPEMNVGTELTKAFEVYKDNPGEMEQLRAKAPQGLWQIDAATLQEVADILTRTEQKRLNIREMLGKDGVCFSFHFVHDPDYGDVPDTEASDYLSDYLLLEEYAIAQALAAGEIDQAIDSLAFIFRLAQLAAEVKNVGIRTRACEVRMRAIDVMQGVVLAPAFRQSHAVKLLGILQEQMDMWTPESAMWIGDRASGLVVYNLIRQYGLESALEPDELAELRQRGIFESLSKNLLHTLPADQTAYMKIMQRVIDESDRPLFERRPEWNKIESDLLAKRGASDEPVIAEMLLRGVPEIMLYCAQDRAKCETAVLALATSLGQTVATTKRPDAKFELDPIFGRKYEINKDAGFVTVSFYAAELKPFRTPDFQAQK